MSIPEEPKIQLGNYLLDLVSETDGKESSVYLKDVENFIKEIWNEMLKCNQKKINLLEFVSAGLDIHYNSFYGYKNGRKRIAIQMLFNLLQLWKNFCNKSEEDFRRKWDEIFNSSLYFSVHGQWQPVILPKYINPKLSYLIGWLCGDGYFSKRGYFIKISEKSIEQLKLVLKPLFKELFNLNVPFFKGYGNGYRLQVGCKSAYRFLRNVLKIEVGKIPEIVKIFDNVNKSYFLRGIFDSEGYVSKSRNRAVISQNKIKFLKEVIRLLKDLRIYPNGPTFHKTNLGEWYSIKIDSKSEFLKFAKAIGSSHVDKSKLIQVWVNKIENRNSRSSLT